MSMSRHKPAAITTPNKTSSSSDPIDTMSMSKKYKINGMKYADTKHGPIHEGCERDTNQLVAVKCIMKSDELGVSKIMQLNHSNVIRCLRTETDDTFLYLVFERLPLALDDSRWRRAIIENQVSMKCILQGILRGVEYLRSQNITHEDLRPEFVLLDPESKRIKIAYFGEPFTIRDLYKYWSEDEQAPNLRATTASLYYRAPETLFCDSSKVADMWSVGCIFGEMVTRQPLFPHNSWFHLISSITGLLGKPKPEVYGKFEMNAAGFLTLYRNFDYKDLTKEFPGLEPAGVDLISRMLCLDPDQRITPQEALEHEYFKDL